MRTIYTLLFTALAVVPAVFATQTKTWTHKTQADFEKGTLKGVSLRSDGQLSLAPGFRQLFDAGTAYLWAVAVDSKGTLYTGGGNPSSNTAKLFAVDSAGKSRTVAELPGLEIHAVAVDKADGVYVATAPDGKIYRIDADGKFSVFYEPKTKYVWAMRFNSKGDLFVATGDGGEVHKVAPTGQGSVFFRTEEVHARSLAIDAQDNLLVGTDASGLVVRVSPSGQGFVLYQTDKREVTSIAVAADGTIYAAAVGAKSAATPPLIAPIVAPTPGPAATVAASSAAAAGPRPATLTTPSPLGSALQTSSGGSDVYRIDKDGYPKKIWSHPQDIVYSIAFDANRLPLLATGNKGGLYRVDSDLLSSLLVDAEATQLTGLTTGTGAKTFAISANPGLVFEIGVGQQSQGSYESAALDAGSFAYWGKVGNQANAGSSALAVETRSGNLDRPQQNWSPWAPLDKAGRIASPPARFLQYRLAMKAAPGAPAAQTVQQVEIAYLPKNVPPAIQRVEITPANYQFPASVAATPASTSITLPSIDSPVSSPTTPALTLSTLSSSAQTMSFAKGQIGTRWSASDPNSDVLQFRVEIKGVQDKEWKLVRDKVRDRFASWDSSAYADGAYLVRVTASDSTDNAPEQALQTSVESNEFLIDNTAPVIGGLSGRRSGNELSLQWHAQDALSPIRKAEYSIDGREWIVVEPTTRLSDAPALDYALKIPGTAGPESLVAVRVTDAFQNQAVAKVTIP
jgi:hypothetical protein